MTHFYIVVVLLAVSANCRERTHGTRSVVLTVWVYKMVFFKPNSITTNFVLIRVIRPAVIVCSLFCYNFDKLQSNLQ